MTPSKYVPEWGGQRPQWALDDRYLANATEEAEYEKVFRKLATGGEHLSGKRAALLLRKSGLPQEALSRVWALSDADKDGMLSISEFCTAMHLITCVKTRRLPLPDAESLRHSGRPASSTQTRGDRHAPARSKSGRRMSANTSDPPRSPKRQSRLSSLIGSNDAVVHAPEDEASTKERFNRAHDDTRKYGRVSAPQSAASVLQSMSHKKAATQARCGSDDASSVKATDACAAPDTEQAREGAPRRRRRPLLHKLDANNVNAVFARGQGAINFLRDVQSWRVFGRGMDRLEAKDKARGVPVQMRTTRRHSIPQATKGTLACTREFLPGRGRRTSILLTAYEPSAVHIRQRVEKNTVAEVELARATATAAAKWGLKPLPENPDSMSTPEEVVGAASGDLNVAGIPLLDEDVEILVHILKQNRPFRRLDLSTCFLSDSHFLSLAQALAWNTRIQELCMKGCVFTEASAATLADVFLVNKYIHSLDLRGCTGLKQEGLQAILRAATETSSVKSISGLELAALRTDGSNHLNLSGWALGYVEAVVVAHCLRTRDDGLAVVDLHDNLLTTKSFVTLMPALRRQTQLQALDLSHNRLDEGVLSAIAELLARNTKLSSVKLTANVISCTEFEYHGLRLMRLLSCNNVVTVFDLEENDVTPKMMTIIAEKLAASRGVRKDMTFLDCLHLKYPRMVPKPAVPDPRKLHLHCVDVPFMIQENIPPTRVKIRTEFPRIITVNGSTPALPLDLYCLERGEIGEKGGAGR